VEIRERRKKNKRREKRKGEEGSLRRGRGEALMGNDLPRSRRGGKTI